MILSKVKPSGDAVIAPANQVSNDVLEESEDQLHERFAAQYGTPFYAYDASEIAARVAELKAVFPSAASTRLMYSFKANPLPSVAGEMQAGGCCADLTSPGEIAAALEAGFDMSRALYGGPGNSVGELVAAIEAGIRHFSVESMPDMESLEEATRLTDISVRALLRINPIEAPKAKLAMTGVPSQFGFEEEFLRASGPAFLAGVSSRISVVGIHVYWGTQIGGPEALINCFERAVSLAEDISELLAFPLEILNLGGGFPWPYSHTGSGPDLSPLADDLAALYARSRSAKNAEWWFESGRYLVASSGSLVTRVMEIKTSKDDKVFLILDTGIHHLGGMAGLGRIPRFSIDLVVPPHRTGNEEMTVDVVGQLCTPLDCIGRRITIPKVEIGDLLVIPNTGAYGMTASVTGFLSRPTPAEIVHRDGRVISAHRLRSGHEAL